MKKAFFRRTLLISAVAILIGSVIMAVLAQRQTRDQRINAAISSLQTLSGNSQGQTAQADFERAVNSYAEANDGERLTVIAPDGTVMADSIATADSLENHADRPEIIEARREGTGISQRQSDSLGRDTHYVAVLADNGYIYRAAIHVDSIGSAFLHVLPMVLIAAAVSIVIAIVGTRLLSSYLTKPVVELSGEVEKIGGGAYGEHVGLPSYEELLPLAVSINAFSDNIAETLRDLHTERQKNHALLDNLQDGLLLVDSEMTVVTVNRAAQGFLQIEDVVEGKSLSYLTHNGPLIEAVQSAVGDSAAAAVFDITLDHLPGRTIACSVLPATGSWTAQRPMAIVVFRDATEERMSQHMRTEFFQNASHELKTPITSISGFAQLLAQGAGADESVRQEYLTHIVKEASRMTALIEDILKISRYEEAEITRQSRLETVDVSDVAQAISKTLEPAAREKNLTLDLNCEPAPLRAVKKEIEDILQNLMDNAVKYSFEGGRVDVSIKPSTGGVQIRVRDTGIGIPAADLPRISERFYRVDKDRNRQVGGTGLGLAIVKHVVALYAGTFEIKSVEGSHTTVTIFVKNGV